MPLGLHPRPPPERKDGSSGPRSLGVKAEPDASCPGTARVPQSILHGGCCWPADTGCPAGRACRHASRHHSRQGRPSHPAFLQPVLTNISADPGLSRSLTDSRMQMAPLPLRGKGTVRSLSIFTWFIFGIWAYNSEQVKNSRTPGSPGKLRANEGSFPLDIARY